MKFSNLYLGLTVIGVTIGVIFGLIGQYLMMGVPILVGVVFFIVYIFARIFETLNEIDANNRKGYEEMERIFQDWVKNKNKKRYEPWKSKKEIG